MMSRLTRRSRGTGGKDAGFALVLSIFLMLVIAALSVGVAGVVAGQVGPTQLQQKTASTLDNAQAGLQAALNGIRNATSGSGAGATAGNLSLLPCSVTGQVGTGNTYTATIEYFDSDPRANITSSSWTALTTAGGHQISCSNTAGLAVIPAWALIQSYGAQSTSSVFGISASQGNRNLHEYYEFGSKTPTATGGNFQSTTTTTGAGGLAAGQCWDAGSANPAVGQAVLTQPCAYEADGVTPIPQQRWVATPYASGGFFVQYGGNPALNLCVKQGPTNLILQSCTITTSTTGSTTTTSSTGCNAVQLTCYLFNYTSGLIQGITSTGATGSCIGAAVGSTLGYSTCTGGSSGTAAFNAGIGVNTGISSIDLNVGTSSAGVTAGVGLCAISTGGSCMLGASASVTINPATGTVVATLTVSILGIPICVSGGVTGGIIPVFGIGFGSSCTAGTTTSVAPSAVATAAAVAFPSTYTVSGLAGASVTQSPAYAGDIGEGTGGSNLATASAAP